MVRISETSLIKLILNNGRFKYVDVAKKLGFTESAVRKKVAQLEKKGIIRGYYSDVNPKELGYKIVGMIGVDTTPEEYMRVSKILKKDKQILKLWNSTGDHMFLFEVWFKSNEELGRFTERLEGIKGITKVCPAILLGRLK